MGATETAVTTDKTEFDNVKYFSISLSIVMRILIKKSISAHMMTVSP